MKKYLLNLSVIVFATAPISAVVSCNKNNEISKAENGNHAGEKETWKKQKNGEIIVNKSKKRRSPRFGLKNYKYPKVTNAEDRNMREYKTRLLTGETFAPHFMPADIPNWKIGNETDGNYSRSHVPLAKRKFALEKAKNTKGNGRFFSVNTLRKNTSNSLNKTSSFDSKNSQIMQGLQYMTDMIAFGGSAGEGEVYIPRAQDIDAYHRMGIKVHACIYFGIGTSAVDYAYLMGQDLQKSADNLIKMAKYYGFDGWFINDENESGQNWANFMKILHKKAKKANIEISYYRNGNTGFVYKAGDEAYDTWFNDYGYGQGMASGIKESQSPVGYNGNDSEMLLKKNKGKSFWTYREWENGAYYQNERTVKKFFNGNRIKDPRQSTKGGLAYWYKEYTPFIKHESFATSFNKGNGHFYNIKSKKIKNTNLVNGYSNMALQDYLPTWKYIIDVIDKDGNVDMSKIGKTGIRIYHKETPNAWMGSDALFYKGKIGTQKTITNKLFASEFALEKKDSFSFMYKGKITPSLAIWTKNESTFKKHIIDGKVSKNFFNNDYKSITFDVSSLKGEVVTSFGVAFKNNYDKELRLSFTLGRLSFNANNDKVKKRVEIKKMYNDGEWMTANGKNIRLRWETSSKDIKEYLVYATDNKYKNKKLIGITNSPSILLRGLGVVEKTRIIIIPIDKMMNPLEEVKVLIMGDKLDFTDNSKWSHKSPMGTGEYGVQTGHGFIGKVSDGDGGFYFINDQVSVVHFSNMGTVESKGNYNKPIFNGKSSEYNDKYDMDDGVTFGTAFVNKEGNIFISRRAGQNGLYVFSKGMKQSSAKWDKYKENNSIFKNKDEYIAKIFQQPNSLLLLISSMGNIATINIKGELSFLKQKNIFKDNNNSELELSVLKIGDVTHITSSNGSNSKMVTIDSNNNIKESNLNFGYILYSKTINNQITIVSAMDTKIKNKKKIKISKYDISSKKIIFSKILQTGEGKSINILKKYFNTVILSEDGKKLFMRDIDHQSWRRPEEEGYAEDSAYIVMVDISNISKENVIIDSNKSLPTTYAIKDRKSYAGDYVNMVMLKDGKILYGTSDFGRIGIIGIKTNKAKLVEIFDVQYRFKLNNEKKINAIVLKTFFGDKKSSKNLPVNPYKKDYK